MRKSYRSGTRKYYIDRKQRKTGYYFHTHGRSGCMGHALCGKWGNTYAKSGLPGRAGYPYGPDELYHLRMDRNEEHNLIHEEEFEQVRPLLLAELEEWFARYADPAMDGCREAVYGMGQIERAGLYAGGKKNYITCPQASPSAWPDN